MEDNRAFMIIKLGTVCLEFEDVGGFDEGTGFDFGFELMEIILSPLIGWFLIFQRDQSFLIDDSPVVYFIFLLMKFLYQDLVVKHVFV